MSVNKEFKGSYLYLHWLQNKVTQEKEDSKIFLKELVLKEIEK